MTQPPVISYLYLSLMHTHSCTHTQTHTHRYTHTRTHMHTHRHTHTHSTHSLVEYHCRPQREPRSAAATEAAKEEALKPEGDLLLYNWVDALNCGIELLRCHLQKWKRIETAQLERIRQEHHCLSVFTTKSVSINLNEIGIRTCMELHWNTWFMAKSSIVCNWCPFLLAYQTR